MPDRPFGHVQQAYGLAEPFYQGKIMHTYKVLRSICTIMTFRSVFSLQSSMSTVLPVPEVGCCAELQLD